jgi:hypothetical protein
MERGLTPDALRERMRSLVVQRRAGGRFLAARATYDV